MACALLRPRPSVARTREHVALGVLAHRQLRRAVAQQVAHRLVVHLQAAHSHTKHVLPARRRRRRPLCLRPREEVGHRSGHQARVRRKGRGGRPANLPLAERPAQHRERLAGARLRRGAARVRPAKIQKREEGERARPEGAAPRPSDGARARLSVRHDGAVVAF